MDSPRIRARVPGIDPRRFWQAAPGRVAWQSMVDKYALLAELARLPEQRRKPSLREAASRWPGSLREAELIGPERVDARAEAAAFGLGDPERARATWIEAPALAVILWAQLHGLLADQRRFRASGSSKPSDARAFSGWILAHDHARRWPDAERIPELVGPKLRVRSAYLWLAAHAGMDLPSLNAVLLARAGHWDRRPEDPAWAHAP